MEKKIKNLKRNVAISFRTTEEERRQIFARINVCGMPKADYFIQSLLHQQIVIAVGKYKSDRLAVELKKLRLSIEKVTESFDEKSILEELINCKYLLEQIIEITESNSKNDGGDENVFK
jgi:hypothetical protein